jgi:tetratricopeptide (TPR) repeat protein
MKPKVFKAGSRAIFFLLPLFVLAVGCSGRGENKAMRMEKASQHFEKGEFKKALIELKNVVQLDPEDDEAYYQLGETYLKLKQGQEAMQSLSRATSINPDNLRAQLKMGQIFLLAKETEQARKKAELVLEKTPEETEALALLSGVQIQEKDLGTAIKTLEKATSINPGHFKSHLSLARLFLINRDLDRAEQAYLKAISLDPVSPVPRVELSFIYVTRGQWDKAESELMKMIQASATRYQHLPVLGRFYESRKKWDQAEKIYLESVESAPKEDVAPLMNLGGYYARRRSYEKALEALKKASALKKDDPNILASIAQLHFDFKKMKDAEDMVGEVLEKDKGHVGVTFLKGRLYLIRKDFDNALECFDFVVREDSRNAMAHYYKALCLMGKGDRKLAEQDLLQAVELKSDLLDARLILAESYLRERNQRLARQQIESALELAPNHTTALTLQGNLKIQERDLKGAELALQRVIELVPDYAAGYVRLGMLYNILGRSEDARASFEKAIELNPFQIDALALIVNMYLRGKKFNEALKVCNSMKGQTAENPYNLALIEYLEGSIFSAKKEPRKAQKHYENAIKSNPNILAPYVALARIYLRGGKSAEAISQYESILKMNPKHFPGYMALGTIYDQQGDGEKAETYYRKALEIKQDFAPAANNLAWNLAERGGNIDEALNFAQIAREKMPKNAAVMDTLGWIYYLKGSYLNAIAEFQDSLELDPKNPVTYYHLGLAYYKNNHPNGARECLEKALELERGFRGADQASSILKELKTSTEAQ